MLTNKLALVTGSTSGIGLGIATALAKAGANIILNGFGNASDIEKLVKSLSDSYKVKVSYSDADMTKPAMIAEMIEEAAQRSGAIDILVNNAGVQYVSPIDNFPEEQWDKIIAINLSSAFHTIKHVVPSMKKKKWGRIINVASAHGLVGSVNKSAYVASKHGLVGLTKVVALENAENQITCNAICPGWVLTPLVQKQIEERAKGGMSMEQAKYDLLFEKQPSLRFVEVEHLGELAVFLCSEAGGSITGSSYSMDGGWTAR